MNKENQKQKQNTLSQKQKQNRKTLKRMKIKKYTIVTPLFFIVIISILSMFIIPDIFNGNRLGSSFMNISDSPSVEYNSDEYMIQQYDTVLESQNNNDNQKIKAYILLSYILNIIILIISILLGLYLYIKYTNRIENFERYRTL